MTQARVQSTNVTEVAIIGAGPYGLSVAAYLAGRGVSFRIFGDAMSAWANQMPKGMKLKSEGFASSLADPRSEFTLAHYCKQQGLPYKDEDLPVPLETFVAYGVAFQKKFAPNLENKKVVSIRKSQAGFELTLADQETLFARNVVMAIGIVQFWHLPAALSGLSPDLVSHSSVHSDLQSFKGRRVAVIGAGASALDLAALLHQAGASTEVIARASKIRFHNPPAPRSLWERISRPKTGIGMGWDYYFFVTTPHLFRLLPESLRLDRVRKILGPAPGWFIKDAVVGKVPMRLHTDVTGAKVENGRVKLQLTSGGQTETAEFDHVIAATGYQVDVQRISMLREELRKDIRLTGTSPLLSAHFESSVPGLYFVGVAAANTFGPVMRFAYGAEWTAKRVSRRLAKSLSGATVPYAQPSNLEMLQKS